MSNDDIWCSLVQGPLTAKEHQDKVLWGCNSTVNINEWVQVAV